MHMHAWNGGPASLRPCMSLIHSYSLVRMHVLLCKAKHLCHEAEAPSAGPVPLLAMETPTLATVCTPMNYHVVTETEVR